MIIIRLPQIMTFRDTNSVYERKVQVLIQSNFPKSWSHSRRRSLHLSRRLWISSFAAVCSIFPENTSTYLFYGRLIKIDFSACIRWPCFASCSFASRAWPSYFSAREQWSTSSLTIEIPYFILWKKRGNAENVEFISPFINKLG